MEALKAQFQYHIIAKYSDYLSENLIEAKAKYERASYGAAEMQTQDEITISGIQENFPDMIGKVYIAKYFGKI